MSAVIIDGKAIAEDIRNQVAVKVAQRKRTGLSVPGLATVLVGDDPASQVYVRSKHRACEKLGIRSFSHVLPASTPQSEVMALVDELNHDANVHGILVQLPLPNGINEEEVLLKISVKKDVDGFHPINIGNLAQKGRTPSFIPCTPTGIIHLLKTTMPSLEGKNAVVLGRSNIVGMPVALLLVRENATVTICHSRSQDLPKITAAADILVASVGRAEMVRADWVKSGAVVIDVGINRVDDPTKERGYRLVGDVAYDEVREVAAAITPVPGGVGPMTIAMLMQNTLRAAELSD